MTPQQTKIAMRALEMSIACTQKILEAPEGLPLSMMSELWDDLEANTVKLEKMAASVGG